MVEEQIRARGINDERVLSAMSIVPREAFVPANVRGKAYEDRPLSIGFGQTISQPYTVAFQCEALRLHGEESVLEIGTGCGYAAAVLSHLAKRVFTIERVSGLVERARDTLEQLAIENVQLFMADGTLGLPQHAPYQAIVVTAGGKELPTPFKEQLAVGGRIVVPLGDNQRAQAMLRFTKRRESDITVENLGSFSFVPLIGRFGWGEEETDA